MSIRLIASVVIAALLMTGPASAAPQTSEYGAAQQPATPTVTAMLTAEEAQAIALAHAGLTAAEVTGLRSRYDRYDRVPEWEIEFRSGDWEFDYEIHAETGAVLDWDKEYDPPKVKEPQPTQPPVTEPPVTEPPVTEPPVTQPPVTEPPDTEPAVQKLTAEEARAIALAHAGLTAEQVTRLHSEYDMDDGVPEWEIEFRSDGWEYEYEIHAETGVILQSEKEWDD